MPSSKKITLRRLALYLCALGFIVLARPHPVLYPIGLCLVAVGEGLRLFACGHLRKNKDVIMSGPFAYVKNPLYVGTFLIVTGFCIMASNPDYPSRYILFAGLPLFLVNFFFYYLPYKVRVEGDRLRRRFGETFDEYDRNVPNFFPRLTPFKDSNVRWDLKLLTENSEWGTLAGVIAGSVLVFAKFYIPI